MQFNCVHLTFSNYLTVHHYNSYRQFIRQKFGVPVLKIPLNGGFSCPNRDGSKSTTGCFFCDNRSFSPAFNRIEPPHIQLQKVINNTSNRFRAFIPYLQPFSNTYGSVEELSLIYESLITLPGVVGLAIGTRPDCFSDELFTYLSDLNRRTYLSIELGLQSAHDSTLLRINRGHTFEDFVKTSNRLADSGIEVVAHVMLGLPGENPDIMIQTARELSKLKIKGVKIHQLMIIKGTIFEELFLRNEINTLDIYNYSELLCDFLDNLRPDQLIHRLMADSKPEHGLIAPVWSAKKTDSLNIIHKIMDQKGSIQGAKFYSG